MNILMNRPIAALLLCTLSFAIATPSPVEDNDDTDPSQTNNFFFRFFLGDGEGANIYNQMDMNSERDPDPEPLEPVIITEEVVKRVVIYLPQPADQPIPEDPTQPDEDVDIQAAPLNEVDAGLIDANSNESTEELPSLQDEEVEGELQAPPLARPAWPPSPPQPDGEDVTPEAPNAGDEDDGRPRRSNAFVGLTEKIAANLPARPSLRDTNEALFEDKVRAAYDKLVDRRSRARDEKCPICLATVQIAGEEIKENLQSRFEAVLGPSKDHIVFFWTIKEALDAMREEVYGGHLINEHHDVCTSIIQDEITRKLERALANASSELKSARKRREDVTTKEIRFEALRRLKENIGNGEKSFQCHKGLDEDASRYLTTFLDILTS